MNTIEERYDQKQRKPIVYRKPHSMSELSLNAFKDYQNLLTPAKVYSSSAFMPWGYGQKKEIYTSEINHRQNYGKVLSQEQRVFNNKTKAFE